MSKDKESTSNNLVKNQKYKKIAIDLNTSKKVEKPRDLQTSMSIQNNQATPKSTKKEMRSSNTLKKINLKKDPPTNISPQKNEKPEKIEKTEKPTTPNLPEGKTNTVNININNTNGGNFQINLNATLQKCSKTVELDLGRCNSEKMIFKKVSNFNTNIIPTVRTNLYDGSSKTDSNNSLNNNTTTSSSSNTIFNKFKRSILSLSEARKNKNIEKQNTSSFSEESINTFSKIKDSIEQNTNLKREISNNTNNSQSKRSNNHMVDLSCLKKTFTTNIMSSYEDNCVRTEHKRSSLSFDSNSIKTEGNAEVGSSRRRVLDEYRNRLKLMNLNKGEYSYPQLNTEI